MTPEAFVSAARSFVGAKWRHRGRTSRHMDCIGLLALSFKRAGVPFEDEHGYGREPWDDRLRKGSVARWGQPVTNPQVGDIVLIRYASADPAHIGIVGEHPDGGLSLIHSHNLHGVIEQALRDRIAAMVVEVYRPWP